MNKNNLELIPLLVPEMPRLSDLQPWIEKIDNSKIYTNFGPLVKDLELIFSSKFSVNKKCITTVANATLGLELVLQSLKLKKNAKILIPAFTFVATATAVIRAGFEPIMADIALHNWMLTPDIARKVLRSIDFDAVMPVATFGMPHDMREWNIFENETGIPVVIDAAAAYGAQWLDGCEGTLVFSLHATKSLPAGEGGFVVSTKPGLAEEVRERSNFGIYLNNKSSHFFGKLSTFGTNAKMSEYHAAVALASLQKWDINSEKRGQIYSDFKKIIEEASDGRVIFQENTSRKDHCIFAPTSMCIRLPNAEKRNILEKKCQDARISTRRWYQSIIMDAHLMKESKLCVDLPNTSILGDCLLGLPFFLGLSHFQLQRIENVIRNTFNKSD